MNKQRMKTKSSGFLVLRKETLCRIDGSGRVRIPIGYLPNTEPIYSDGPDDTYYDGTD